jgi:hypothetical protein
MAFPTIIMFVALPPFIIEVMAINIKKEVLVEPY